MKKLVTLLLALLLLTAPAAMAAETLVVGASPAPHAELLELIKDSMMEKGYNLEIMVFTDYVLPNTTLSDAEIAANFFQHKPYMNQFNESLPEDKQLVAAIPVHYEPYGLYAGKTLTVEELKTVEGGATISINNDAANETRALILLEDAALITLPEGRDPGASLTVADIVENPYGINFIEMDASQLPSTLQDVDMAVINGNYAIDAGFKPSEDAVYLESSSSDTAQMYTNYVVVRVDSTDATWLKDLEDALYCQAVYDYLLECGVVPMFTVE